MAQHRLPLPLTWDSPVWEAQRLPLSIRRPWVIWEDTLKHDASIPDDVGVLAGNGRPPLFW